MAPADSPGHPWEVGLDPTRSSQRHRGVWGVTFQNVPHCLPVSKARMLAMCLDGHMTLSWDPAQACREALGSPALSLIRAPLQTPSLQQL